jgi:hypothetical protein
VGQFENLRIRADGDADQSVSDEASGSAGCVSSESTFLPRASDPNNIFIWPPNRVGGSEGDGDGCGGAGGSHRLAVPSLDARLLAVASMCRDQSVTPAGPTVGRGFQPLLS